MAQTLLTKDQAKEQCYLLGKVWETLDDTTADLANHGVTIPPEIYTSLRNTKALITECQTQPNELTPAQIDNYLGF